MNTPNPALAAKIEAPRGVLRPSETLPRPIPLSETSPRTIIGGER
jgi:hypothetical protein